MANSQVLSLAQAHTVPVDSLVLVLRVQESRNTTPQAQKILKELGLKEVNNAAFVMATTETIKQLMLVKDYVAYGLPSKAVLEELIRKRGFLKAKDSKRVPISDNVMIEELLGEDGCICVEDVIDSFWRCKQNAALYKRVKEVLWPIQLAARKETASEKITKHEATSRDVKKTLTAAWKGGYLGYMGDKINEFVQALI